MHPTDFTWNEYVDGDLPAREHAEAARHLDTCAECRALIADLQELTRAAAALGPLEPPAHVWTRVRRAHRWPSVFSLAAAALFLIATVAGLRVGPLAHRPAADTVARTSADTNLTGGADNGAGADAAAAQAETQYESAISGLEAIATAEHDTLDAGTARTLQENLALIDRAIGESRAALMTEPQSTQAQDRLIEALQIKMAVLQDTVTLMHTLRKGHEG